VVDPMHFVGDQKGARHCERETLKVGLALE
jgi:hypothetical protein